MVLDVILIGGTHYIYLQVDSYSVNTICSVNHFLAVSIRSLLNKICLYESTNVFNLLAWNSNAFASRHSSQQQFSSDAKSIIQSPVFIRTTFVFEKVVLIGTGDCIPSFCSI